MQNVIVNFTRGTDPVIANTMMVTIPSWGDTEANDYNVGSKFDEACTVLGFESAALVSYSKLDLIYTGQLLVVSPPEL